jgi:hypothetical protein
MTNIERIKAVFDFKFPEPFQIGETTVSQIVDGEISGLTLDELADADLQKIVDHFPDPNTFKGKKLLRSRYAWLKGLRVCDFDNRVEYLTERLALQTEINALFEVMLIDVPEMIYSKNQLQFIDDAQNCGLDIDYGYSGRGMFGDTCPAVRIDHPSEITTKAQWVMDNMGLGVVVYAQN